jgi:hypothetical protein
MDHLQFLILIAALWYIERAINGRGKGQDQD